MKLDGNYSHLLGILDFSRVVNLELAGRQSVKNLETFGKHLDAIKNVIMDV